MNNYGLFVKYLITEGSRSFVAPRSEYRCRWIYEPVYSPQSSFVKPIEYLS